MEKYGNNFSPESGENSFVEIEERVRYSETDKMGVAHNKNYFEWFEIGRTEYCRKKKIQYKDIEAKGYFLVVAEAFCRYKRPLRYDDRFLIRIYLTDTSQRKIVFNYELLEIKNKKTIALGYTVHVVTDSKAKVCSMPQEILNQLKS